MQRFLVLTLFIIIYNNIIIYNIYFSVFFICIWTSVFFSRNSLSSWNTDQTNPCGKKHDFNA